LDTRKFWCITDLYHSNQFTLNSRMERIWLQTCFTVALFMIYFTPSEGLRADLLEGFELCPGKQLGRLVSVDVDGPGCYRRDGSTQWPCFLYPGRTGVFRIAFTHDRPEPLTKVKSSIHALATYRGLLSFTGEQRVPFFGEVSKDVCPAVNCPVRPGYVHMMEKTFTVPSAVRLVEQNMKTEFKLTTGIREETVICFIVPVINQ